jgi:oligosaccharide repeat unit polymerase
MEQPYSGRKLTLMSRPTMGLWAGLVGLGFVGLLAANLSTEDGVLRLTILIVSIAFLIVALGPLARGLFSGQGNFFELDRVFLLFFCLFALSYPVGLAIDPEGVIVKSSATSLTVRVWPLGLILKALLLCFLGLLGFRIGYRSRLATTFARGLPALPEQWDPHRAYAVIYAYLILGILLYLRFVYDVGGFASYLDVSYGGAAESYRVDQTRGYLKIGWVMIQVCLLLLYCVSRSNPRGSRLHRLFISCLYIIFIALSFMVGRRSHVVSLVLATLAARHFLVRRLPPRTMALLLGVGLMVMLSFSYVRGYLSRGVGEAAQIIEERFEPAWLDLSDSYFGSPYIWTMTDTLTSVPRDMDYWYGRSYVEAPLILLPRTLVPDRPLPPSEWYSTTFHPTRYVLGYGFGFFIVGEAYLNFGPVGPLIVLFIYGLLFSGFDQYFRLHPKNISILVLFCLLFPECALTLNDGFAIFFKYFVRLAIIMAPLILFSRKWKLPQTMVQSRTANPAGAPRFAAGTSTGCGIPTVQKKVRS